MLVVMVMGGVVSDGGSGDGEDSVKGRGIVGGDSVGGDW